MYSEDDIRLLAASFMCVLRFQNDQRLLNLFIEAFTEENPELAAKAIAEGSTAWARVLAK